jgi:hypothetical protein
VQQYCGTFSLRAELVAGRLQAERERADSSQRLAGKLGCEADRVRFFLEPALKDVILCI